MVETPTGAAAVFPIDDDVVSGAIVAESAASTAGAVTFDAISFVKCPQTRSNIIRVPLELLQDAFTTFDTLVSPVLARRIARAISAAGVTSLIADSDVAVTAASTTAATAAEILDLMGSLDPAHSKVGGFLMNETTLTAIKKLTTYVGMVSTDAAGRATSHHGGATRTARVLITEDERLGQFDLGTRIA